MVTMDADVNGFGLEELADEDEEGLEIESEVEVTLLVPEGWSVSEVMRLRAALMSAGTMLSGALEELRVSGSLDFRMDLAFQVFSSSGFQAVETARISLDAWLEDHDFPLVGIYPVESTNLAAMGWADGTAVVEFTNGSVYAYQSVHEDVFDAWWNATSRGGFLAAEIKDRYEFRRLV